MDYLFVELIIAKLALSRRQRELIGSGEGEEQSSFLAVRAIARNDSAQIGGHLVADAPAMATPGIGLGGIWFCHVAAPRRDCLYNNDVVLVFGMRLRLQQNQRIAMPLN